MEWVLLPKCCRECVYLDDINEDVLAMPEYACRFWYSMKKEDCKRQRRPTKRAPDAEEASASQSVSNAETLPTSDSVPPSASVQVA